MTKRAFFVIGPEGSGTNMLAEAFVSVGCHYNPEHNSHLNDYDFEMMPDPFVIRRSLPHAGEWPDIALISKKMEDADFGVFKLFMIRDWYCSLMSVVRRDPNKYSSMWEAQYQGGYEVRDAVRIAINSFGNELHSISYEAFCLDPEYRRWLFVDRFGLKEPTIEIKYANTKYYD